MPVRPDLSAPAKVFVQVRKEHIRLQLLQPTLRSILAEFQHETAGLALYSRIEDELLDIVRAVQ